jgi:hypothetical protein
MVCEAPAYLVFLELIRLMDREPSRLVCLAYGVSRLDNVDLCSCKDVTGAHYV